MKQRSRKLLTAFTVICLILTSCKENAHEQCPSVSEARAGEDQTIGSSSTSLAANVPESGSGLWSIVYGEGGSITEPANATSTFIGLPDTQYSLRWTINNACGSTSEDDVVIAFTINRLAKKVYLNGQLYLENTYNSSKQLERSLTYFSGEPFESSYTYNANGSLQMITVFGGNTSEQKYYYHATGVLNYVVINEGNPTTESKMVYTFQNSRVLQITNFIQSPPIESSKSIYEYQPDGYLEKIYLFPYSENAAPTRTIVSIFFTDHLTTPNSNTWNIASVSSYLPWALTKSHQNLADDINDYTVDYEFDSFERVIKATFTFPNHPNESNQDVYTYDY